MNNHISYGKCLERLTENGIAYKEMSLGDGFILVVSQYGGRVFGPFEGEKGESILWMNSAFADRTAFAEMIRTKSWNVGGERIWIEPEIPFFVKSRKEFDMTYHVQTEIDPGRHEFLPSDRGILMGIEVDAQLYEMPFHHKKYRKRKRVSAVQNPLKDFCNENHIRYCGYELEVDLEDMSPHIPVELETWFLTQVNPGGRYMIPYLGDFDFVDYYDRVTEEYQKVHSRHVELNITGDRKYKTAYYAAGTFGRSAYINRYKDNEYYLIVRNYYNDPSNPYCSDPWDRPGERGCSAYVYNDDGLLGGYAELENSGRTLGPNTGKKRSEDSMVQWYFFGEFLILKEIIKRLLGIEDGINE